jgi:hypothetical protein
VQREPPQPTVAPGAPQTQSTPGATPTPGATGAPPVPPTVKIGIGADPPTKYYTKSAEVAIRHGVHGSVGWTTPNWETTTLYVTPTDVRIGFKLMFAMDLPSDYDVERRAIVESHEMGHVEIAKQKSKDILETELATQIKALVTVDQASVENLIRDAIRRVSAAEKEGSVAYDARDYPLMLERYKGRRMSLAQLSASSPAIGAAVRAIKRVPSLAAAVNGFNVMQADSICDAVIATAGGISGAAKARTEFNNEFRALLGTATSSAAQLHESLTFLPGIGEGRNESYAPRVAAVISALAQLQP